MGGPGRFDVRANHQHGDTFRRVGGVILVIITVSIGTASVSKKSGNHPSVAWVGTHIQPSIRISHVQAKTCPRHFRTLIAEARRFTSGLIQVDIPRDTQRRLRGSSLRPHVCPLHDASPFSDTPPLLLLFHHVYDRFNKSEDGATALHAAALGGHAACVELLLKNG